MEKISIEGNRFTSIVISLCSTSFVGLYCFYWLKFLITGNPMGMTPIYVILFTLLTFLFLIFAIVFVKKSIQKNNGVIIDDLGISDFSSGVSVGLIEWKDITGIRTKGFGDLSFLLIDTIDPRKYIREANKIKGAALWYNYQIHGTPLTIGANLLNISFKELEEKIRTGFKESRNAACR